MYTLMPKFQKRLLHIAAEKDLSLTPLGEVGKWPMWLVRPHFAYKPKKKKVLICAGFHGEEQAGPWGMLRWLEDFNKENYKGIDISVLPCVNPTAFNRRTRYNTWGEISNQGFSHLELKQEPSSEGKILLRHIDRLYSLAMNGFLSLHEDIELKKEYYLYTFESTKEPGQFTCGMLDTLSKWFEKPLNGASVTSDSRLATPPFVINGLVYKYCDGSLEDYMFHRGCNRVAVSETPGKARLDRRVDANVAIIDTFLDLINKGI